MLWKGKQNKILEEQNWKKEHWCQNVYYYKIAKTFSYCKKSILWAYVARYHETNL